MRPCRAGQLGLAGSATVLTHMPFSTSTAVQLELEPLTRGGVAKTHRGPATSGSHHRAPNSLAALLGFPGQGSLSCPSLAMGAGSVALDKLCGAS